MIFGIDYGSKLAGTTVVAYLEKDRVICRASEKKQDADQMIVDLATQLRPNLIAIDAPLSLPGVYRNLKGYNDHFYRACDREVHAMSPMFLGGLTARAMKLAAQLPEIPFIETYPVKTGTDLGLKDWGYRTKSVDFAAILSKLNNLTGWEMPSTKGMSSHKLDAIMALITAYQCKEGKVRSVGQPNEGLIYY